MDRCPYCGSSSIDSPKKPGMPPRCQDCGHNLPAQERQAADPSAPLKDNTEVVIVCPYCGYRSTTEADRLPDGTIDLQCRKCSHSFPFDRRRALEKPVPDPHPLFDRQQHATSPPVRPRKRRGSRLPVMLLGILLLAGGGLFFALRPSASPPVDTSAFETPTTAGQVRTGAQKQAPKPQIHIQAVNYRGRVLLNGQQIFVFEGEKDRLYEHLDTAQLVPGDNRLMVEYHRRHASGAPHISLKLYQFDWETGEETRLADWTLRNERGRKTFLLSYQPAQP
ncbi:MAG: hypothetical protein D6794_05570 [Deltaproteobacteria bacterium]|nr:MAG: hypothetical protein D6794_05570 [Deltaproteobacteria bacterium]